MIYKQSFLIGLKYKMQYKANFFLDMLKFFFPLLIQYFIWSNVFRDLPSDAEVFGYTYNKMLTYAFFVSLTSNILTASFMWEINSDIKEGTLSKYIIKPFDHLFYNFYRYLGEKVVAVILSLVITVFSTVIINMFFPGTITFSQAFIYYMTLQLSLIINFIIYYTMCSIGFWVIDSSSGLFIISVIGNILSGGIFPLDIFPGRIQILLSFLPFKYLNYFPVSVLIGNITGAEIINGIVIQFIWIVLLYISARKLWKLGLKNYISVGG